MKSFTVATTTASILLAIGSAMAGNCTPGLNYCGSTLMDIGKQNTSTVIDTGMQTSRANHVFLVKGHYQSQIDQAISDAGVPELDNGHESLFHCIGGDNGVISYLGDCPNGCHDAGHGNSDYCVGQE